MRSTLLILSLLLSLTTQARTPVLTPFTSDGCSSSPDGLTANEEFTECCVAHDLLYWKGGTFEQRTQADEDFKSCMTRNGGDLVSLVYYSSVRVGGTPFLPSPWTWGYGWSPLRPANKALTPEELQEIQKNAPNLDIPLPLIKTYSSAEILNLPLKKFLKDTYNFVPDEIGQVYRFVLVQDGRVESLSDTKENFFLLTSRHCPQGYYLTNTKTVQAFGLCPVLRTQKFVSF